jgi:hypothetical protein
MKLGIPVKGAYLSNLGFEGSGFGCSLQDVLQTRDVASAAAAEALQEASAAECVLRSLRQALDSGS